MTGPGALLLAALVLLTSSCRRGSPPSDATSSTRDAPVAVWHMDESSGVTMRDSAGRHHGTIRNVELGQDGLMGKAYGFDGSSSGVQVSDSGSLDPGPGDFSVTVHLRVTHRQASTTSTLSAKGSAQGNY